MLKVLLVALLFATVAFADVSLTGRFATGTATFFPPSTDTACVATTTTTYYKVFNQTFATAGVRVIQLLATTSYPIYIYRGSFTATTPCANAVAVEVDGSTTYRYVDSNNDNTNTLQISEAVSFAADIYFFVVTYTSVEDLPAATYSFGVKVVDPVFSATSTLYANAVTNVWQTPVTQSDGTVYYQGNATYTTFTYTAPTTDRYDVGAFVANATAQYNFDVSLGIFTGTPSAQQIYDASTGVFPSDNDDDEGVWVFFFPMTAGQTYTFVASKENSESETADIGFFVTPTSAHRLTAGSAVTTIFSEPASFSAGSACTSRGSSYVGLPYTTTSFNVVGNIVVAKSSDQYSYNDYLGADLEIDGLDWYTYLYRGNNSVSPAGCPVDPTITYVSSTDDGTIYNPQASAAVHTLVVSTYSSSPSLTATSGIVIFYFVGPTIGEGVSVPTGAPAPSTSTPTTSTPTTSTPTTSTPTTSSPTAAPCRYSITTGTISFNNAVDQCQNATVKAITAGNGINGNTYVCTNGTGLAVTITVGLNASSCDAAVNTTAFVIYLQSFGFTDVSFTFNTAAPTTSTPTTSTPTTSTPTTSTPAPAAGTTSGAASVVASFVVVFAVLGLFL